MPLQAVLKATTLRIVRNAGKEQSAKILESFQDVLHKVQIGAGLPDWLASNSTFQKFAAKIVEKCVVRNEETANPLEINAALFE